MTHALRAIAVVIAIVAVIDPPVAVSGVMAVPVEFEVQSTPSALAIRDRMIRTLGASIAANTGGAADAVVIIGQPDRLIAPRAGARASIVSLVPSTARNVRLIAASGPDAVLVGQEAIVTATFDAIGMKGETSIIGLDREGVRLAFAEHRWTSDRERYTSTLRYAPPAPGLSKLTITSLAHAGEASDEDNSADMPLLVSARTLRVAIYEPRPSWAAGFVRRALESDPLFVMASLVRPTRAVAVTAGPPLPPLSAAALAPYDAVIVGAPEELTTVEVAALSTFCDVRGGSVIFVPDRRPSGSYARLVSSGGFDETVLDKPVALAGAVSGISASEIISPRRLDPGTTAIASTSSNPVRAVVTSRPSGRGRIVFSGALDAWRFRSVGRDERAFERFWTGIVANLASATPPRVSVAVTPAVAAPGDTLTVRVVADPQFVATMPGREAPVVTMSLVGRDGHEQFVRVWPTTEAGVFEGETAALLEGLYDARARIAESVADTPIMIVKGTRHPPRYDDDTLRMIAETTGGVNADASDTTGVEQHLRSLARRQPRQRHPMRSVWWSLPFSAALCGEWVVRRRQGLK